MIQLNNAILLQFAQKGLSINEGIAIDARLVQSASRPMSNEDIRKRKEKRNTSEGKVDKNGNPLKFSRDIESDWTIKNDTPHYGLKEHASVDIKSGFVLATTLTPASEHDSKYLPYLTIASCYTNDPIETVYGDKGYFGEPNRAFLSLNAIGDGIMRKDTTTAKLTELERERNKKISKKRYIAAPCGINVINIEGANSHYPNKQCKVKDIDISIPRGKKQYFSLSHLYDGAYRARFTTILKNIWDTMCRQMAFNMFRGSKLLANA